MKRILFFQYFLFFVCRFHSSNAQNCPCTLDNGQPRIICSTTGNTSPINTTLCNTTGINSIRIVFSGVTVLSLIAPTTIPIDIYPIDANPTHTLQIQKIQTNATRIDIRFYLSTDQKIQKFFANLLQLDAPNSTLSIRVMQTNLNSTGFEIFPIPGTSQVDISRYELMFSGTNGAGQDLNFPSFVYGLKKVLSITIIGNNHTLVVDRLKMPTEINVNELSLKGLRLNDQILYNITNLQTFTIEECIYGQTSKVLHSTPPMNVSVVMKNNFPLDSVLPDQADAFRNGINLINLDLIEPALNSTSLEAIRRLRSPAKAFIRLRLYTRADMTKWITTDKPIIFDLTIDNIQDLDIFPPGFFNAFHATYRTTLRGNFELKKTAICIFVGMNRQTNNGNSILNLESTRSSSLNDWNSCADTYVKAINYDSTKNIQCPPPNSCEACQKWASDTEKCDLITYENRCSGSLTNPGNIFFYNDSYLYHFFQNKSWLNSTLYGPSISKHDSVNIGAIIGALCGLLVAAVILALTIYCIRRNRRKHQSENVSAPRIEQYKPSAHDNTHVSIATSKSSQSSRYALEHSFFPVVQPKDEIAPPLYTAPSESVGATSNYNAPSAPPARRDSVSTRATHVYETLDP